MDQGAGPEATPGASDRATVLDIGGDIGAAVVLTPASLEGVEIEIRPVGAEWDGTHVAVRARTGGAVPVYAALFGQLASGRYDLRRRDTAPSGIVHHLEVAGGVVTESRWPDGDDPPERSGHDSSGHDHPHEHH